ncbi:MAG: hypothetical protein AB7U46_04955 [Paenirhodobacter sp.]|uniref:calcium-binding protein n=1 Tax=Paenirhodobacter sp. TaxID=1965326 RepID=UPI003D14F5EF
MGQVTSSGANALPFDAAMQAAALSATIRDGWLYVTGAASGATFTGVEISYPNYTGSSRILPVVRQDDGAGTQIAVTSDATTLVNLDLSGLTVSGATVSWYYLQAETSLIGSQQDDSLRFESRTAGVMQGLGGDDLLAGGLSDDRLYGGDGNDTLNGYDGDDTLVGGRGDDTINGGDGIDTVVLRGAISDYEITTSDGSYVITQISGPGNYGTDTVSNVEIARFDDGIVDISAPPTDLEATLSGGRLRLSGAAAQTGAGPIGRIYVYGEPEYAQLSITDNNSGYTTVPVTGDVSTITALNFNLVTGTGISLTWMAQAATTIRGSAQSDSIDLYSTSDCTVFGGAGNDIIQSSYGNDRVWGGWGRDEINSGAGSDTIAGERGNDTINGDAGEDTIVFRGARAEYDITEQADGTYAITHARGTQFDGTDTVINVEHAQFSDGVVDLPPITDLSLELDNGRLTVSGTPAQTGSGISLSYGDGVIRLVDNTPTPTIIEIASAAASIRTVDFSGVSDTGVSFYWNNLADQALTVRGSQQDDAFASMTFGDLRIFGLAGDDTIAGSYGNDTLIGGRGDDIVDGNAGLDTVVFSGDRADYDIALVDGAYVVTHARGTMFDGTDTVLDVEFLQFHDTTIDLSTNDWMA